MRAETAFRGTADGPRSRLGQVVRASALRRHQLALPTLSGHARLLKAAAQRAGQNARFSARIQSSADEPCWAERRPLN
jgi:hypothetical protein